MAGEFNPYLLLQRFGGLVTRDPASQLQPGEASAMANVRTITGAELRKRKGYVALNSTAISSSWGSKTAVTTALLGPGAAYLDGFVYSICGNDAAGGGTDQAYTYKYSVLLNSWTTKTASVARAGPACHGDNGRVYAFGGRSNTTSARAYNTALDTWTALTNLSSGYHLALSNSIVLTNVHVMGDDGNSGGATTNRIYTVATDAWSTGTVLPAARTRGHCMAVSGLGRYMGGSSGAAAVATNYEYTASTDAWATDTAITASKDAGAALSVGGFGIVASGETPSGTIVDTVYRYNPTDDTWATSTALTTAVSYTNGTSDGSTGYVVAGITAYTTRTTNVWSFDPAYISNIYDFQRSDGSRSIMIGTPTNLGYWTGSAFSSLGSSFTGSTSFPWSCATYNDVLYATNGSDTMQKWDGTLTTTTTVQGNAYQTRTALTTARSGVTAFTIGVHGFVCGGTTGSVSAVVERYDDLPNTWTSRTSMNTARQLLAGFAHSEGGYTAGGTTGAVSAVTERFSEVTNTWTAMTAMNTARSGVAGTATTLYGYTSGGTTGAVSAVHEQYNPITNTWTAKTAMTTARQDVAGSTLTDVHIFGGSTGADSAVNERYSESGNSWTTRTAMTTARDLLGSMTATEGIIEDVYSIGGHVAAVSAVTNRYRYATDMWLARANLGTARSSLAGFGLGFKGFACGGTTGSVSAVVEKYFAGATPPKARFLLVHKGYGILGGNPQYASRRHWSALGDLDNWPPENYEDIASDDGDTQTGSFVFNGNEYYAKRDRLYMLPWTDDPGNFQVVPLTPGIGVVSHRSIVHANGKVYFAGERAFYEFDGTSRKISAPIDTTVFALDWSSAGSIVGVDNKQYGEVWWGVSASGSNNTIILAYSYRLSTPDRPVWFRFTGILPSSMAEIEDLSTDLPVVYHGDYAGQVFAHDDSSDNDNGTAITSSWTSGWMALHANQVDQVELRRLLVWVESTTGAGSLTVNLYSNFGSTAIASPTISLSSTTRVPTDISGYAHTLQIALSHSTASQDWQINKLAIGVTEFNEDRIQ